MKTLTAILTLALVLASAGPARAAITTSPGAPGTFPSAVPAGGADATATLQALLNQGGRITFPATNFTTGALYLTNNTEVTGLGAVLTLKAGVTNVGIFNVVAGVNNVLIKNVALNGLDFSPVSSWTSRDGLSNRMGILIDINSKGSRIENVTCAGFNKGIAVTGNQDGLSVFRNGDLVIEGCEGYTNFFGFYAASSTTTNNQAVEYFTPTHMRLHNNVVNFYVGGGNIGVLGDELLEGYIGVMVEGNAQNGAHTFIANNHINHNTSIGILFANVTQGMQAFGNEILATAGATVLISNSVQVSVFGNNCGATPSMVIGASGVSGSSKGPNFIYNNLYSGVWGGTGMRVFDWNNFSNLVTDNTTNAQHWGNYSIDTSTNADPYVSNPYIIGQMAVSPTNVVPAVPFTPNASYYWNSNGAHIFIIRSTGLVWSSTNLLN